MNRLLIGGVALAALIAGPAMAAEMPLKAPAPAPAAISWTGWYIGLNAGYMWGQTRPGFLVDDSNAGYFTPLFVGLTTADLLAVQATGTTPFKNSGFTGGGQIGFNFQTGNIVSGVEVDFQSFNPKGSNTPAGSYHSAGTPGAVCPATVAACTLAFAQSSSGSWLNTDRVRVGIAWDKWLVYGTVGLAVANLKFDSTFADTTTGATGAVPGLIFSGLRSAVSFNQTRVGVAAGGGLEYAFGPWSLRGEFLYVQIDRVGGDTLAVSNGALFGRAAAACSPVTVPGLTGLPSVGCPTFKYDVTLADFIVRAGINYRFGWAEPVVARY
jgi:outer membrane immunogenic protein